MAKLSLPKPPNSIQDLMLKTYLEKLVSAIEQQLNRIQTPTNTTYNIEPKTSTTATTTSISGNTVDVASLRDFVTTVVFNLKRDGKVN